MTKPETIEEQGYNLIVLQSKHLECTTSGHNKFWKSWLCRNQNVTGSIFDWWSSPFVVKLHYGAIGTKGAVLLKGFGTLIEAERYSSGRVKDKLDKGYITVRNTNITEIAKTKAKKPVEFDSRWDLI